MKVTLLYGGESAKRASKLLILDLNETKEDA
jgi:hypothetical protein